MQRTLSTSKLSPNSFDFKYSSQLCRVDGCPPLAQHCDKMIASLASNILGLSTFTQVLFQLPLALDWLGAPSFLLLSLLLFTYQCSYATFRLLTRNTPLASLMGLYNLVNPFVPTLCALATCWMYLYPPPCPSDGDTSSTTTTSTVTWLWRTDWKTWVGVILPGLYAHTLRLVSPIFSLLEGFATLLVSARRD